MTTQALRTALIWHDEVMDDIVMGTPRTITLGATGDATFVVPDVGLPANFAVVSPGNRGYLLTLGERMTGTICIDGEEKDVGEFVRRGGEGDGPGGFRATPISGKDWGLINLDGTGETKLFFSFVDHEEAPVFFTKQVIGAGAGGWLLSAIILTAVFMLTGNRVDLVEAAFRGAMLASAAIIVSGIVWAIVRQDSDSQASLGFSVILHAAILLMTYQLYSPADAFVWPGPKSLTGNYLVTRLDPEVPPEPEVKPTIGQASSQEAAAASPTKKNLQTATKGDEGASGGKGDEERARDPNAKDVPPEPPKVAFFEDKNKKMLDNIIDRNLSTSLSKFTGIKGDTVTRGAIGFGPGTGSGVGDGTGTGTTRGSKGKGAGGGGQVDGDFVSGKAVDTGKDRPGGTCVGPNCKGAAPRAIALKLEEATGDFNGLSKEEIDRVVKARAGVFRACYQKELNRTPGIGGKLIINFVIDSSGTVKSSRTNGGSLKNDGVESCVKSNIMRLKFPAKGGAIVNYPFVFTQGG